MYGICRGDSFITKCVIRLPAPSPSCWEFRYPVSKLSYSNKTWGQSREDIAGSSLWGKGPVRPMPQLEVVVVPLRKGWLQRVSVHPASAIHGCCSHDTRADRSLWGMFGNSHVCTVNKIIVKASFYSGTFWNAAWCSHLQWMWNSRLSHE